MFDGRIYPVIYPVQDISYKTFFKCVHSTLGINNHSNLYFKFYTVLITIVINQCQDLL